MDNSINGLLREVNDMKSRLIEMELILKDQASTKLEDKYISDYKCVRDAFASICGSTEALSIERMCEYMKRDYYAMIAQKNKWKDYADNLDGVIGNALT